MNFFPIFIFFFYEIELILIKFLHDSYQIPVFQINSQNVLKLNIVILENKYSLLFFIFYVTIKHDQLNCIN